MAKTYQDAIPPEGGREYRLTQLPNGNYTIEDVTVYTQEGTPWGATDVNSMLQDIAGRMPKSGGTFTGEIKATVKGNLIGPLELVDGRVNDLNVPHVPGELRNFVGKQGVAGGPPTDANVIHLAWDNDGNWDGQIAVSNSGSQLYFRSKNPYNNIEWLPWEIAMKKSQFSVRGSTLNISI